VSFRELVQALPRNDMHYRGATLTETFSDEKGESWNLMVENRKIGEADCGIQELRAATKRGRKCSGLRLFAGPINEKRDRAETEPVQDPVVPAQAKAAGPKNETDHCAGG
jgi:hypothetical protein